MAFFLASLFWLINLKCLLFELFLTKPLLVDIVIPPETTFYLSIFGKYRRIENLTRNYAVASDSFKIKFRRRVIVGQDGNIGFHRLPSNSIIFDLSFIIYHLTFFIASKRHLLVAELGFEPRQAESESAVLPLHNSAIFMIKKTYTSSPATLRSTTSHNNNNTLFGKNQEAIFVAGICGC